MKSITRKLDELGRIVLPLEMRRELAWKEKDDIEISITKGGILLKKKHHST